MSSSITTQSLAAGALRQDASLIGLVSVAHLISHFSQLLLAPLFPWLKDAFNASYTELGLLMTAFFVTSCVVQTASGFVVDRFGPRPVLFGGLALLGLATVGFAASANYWTMTVFAIVAGVGNGVFHPVDYTLLNRKVSPSRLGHAYSVHGITGSLGWALAPAMMVSIALAYTWRVALASAGVLVFGVLAVLWLNRARLNLNVTPQAMQDSAPALAEHPMAFLRIPVVWMCFAFFLFFAMALSIVQAFAPEAARQIHGVPLALAAVCLTSYMISATAGMVLGGFLAADAARCERVVGTGFGIAACIALVLALGDLPATAVPVLFGAMGFAAGIAGPARDLLVKKSTPENATGRVYGVVYSGLDIGQAIAPLIFGLLMDHGQFRGVLIGLAVVQGVLIASAFNVRHVRRTAAVPAAETRDLGQTGARSSFRRSRSQTRRR